MHDFKFWMVYGLGHRAPTFEHKSEQSARIEAERLARENRGCTFVVLEAIALVRQPEPPLEWLNKLITEDEIPF